MFSMLKNKNNRIADDYNAIILSAREPKLYTDYGVPDTPQGRFQMIALHASPYFLKYASLNESRNSQKLFDMIFRDIELSFREIGVGDLAVPKKMKRYMQDFNGIIQAHAELNSDHIDITKRNVFGETGVINPAFENYIKGLFSNDS